MYGKDIIKRKLQELQLSFINYYYIKQIDTKILMFHARDDSTIPYYNSIRLAFECDTCKLVLFNRGNHTFLYKNNDIYINFSNFINNVLV